MGLFIGAKPEIGELLFCRGGKVLEFIDDFEGAVDEKGSGAEIEGEAGLIHVFFESSDDDPIAHRLLGDPMGEKRVARGFPQKVVDILSRCAIFYDE